MRWSNTFSTINLSWPNAKWSASLELSRAILSLSYTFIKVRVSKLEPTGNTSTNYSVGRGG
jgi:hypothetical protein